MRTTIVFAACAAALAQSAPSEKPVSAELRAEIRLVLAQQSEAEAKLRAVYDLIMAPINEQKAILLERACKDAGLAMRECEVDLKTWTARKIPPK